MTRWASWLAVVGTIAGCGGMEVSGVVRDQATGEPLPGATVRIGEEVTHTDLGGSYQLEVDADDDEPVRVHADKAGYRAKSDLMMIDDDADRMFRDVELRKQETEAERQDRQQQQRYHEDSHGRSVREIQGGDGETIIIIPRPEQRQEPQRFEGQIELRPVEQGAGQQQGGQALPDEPLPEGELQQQDAPRGE